MRTELLLRIARLGESEFYSRFHLDGRDRSELRGSKVLLMGSGARPDIWNVKKVGLKEATVVRIDPKTSEESEMKTFPTEDCIV